MAKYTVLHKIGNISRMLNITAEALRHYERKEIVASIKDDTNKYRYYKTIDINVLMRSRQYRSCGFALDEIADLTNNKDVDQVMEALSRKGVEIGREIGRLERVKEALRYIQRCAARLPHSLFQCSLEASPAVYVMKYQENEQILKAPRMIERMSAWMKNYTPMVRTATLIARASIETAGDDFSMGISLSPEDAAFFGVKEDELVHFLPSRKSVYTIIRVENDDRVSARQLDYVRTYLEGRGLKLAGDAYGEVITGVRKKTGYTRFHQLWLPVEEK